VYEELSNPAICHLKARLDVLISDGNAFVLPLVVDSGEYSIFRKFSSAPDEGHSIIGKGEAEALAHAITSGGIVASNNLKDVSVYVSKYRLKHITTGDILEEAQARRGIVLCL
jgi:hypothetical protein